MTMILHTYAKNRIAKATHIHIHTQSRQIRIRSTIPKYTSGKGRQFVQKKNDEIEREKGRNMHPSDFFFCNQCVLQKKPQRVIQIGGRYAWMLVGNKMMRGQLRIAFVYEEQKKVENMI